MPQTLRILERLYFSNEVHLGRLRVLRVSLAVWRVSFVCRCPACVQYSHLIVGPRLDGWLGVFQGYNRQQLEDFPTAASCWRATVSHMRAVQGRRCHEPLVSIRGGHYES